MMMMIIIIIIIIITVEKNKFHKILTRKHHDKTHSHEQHLILKSVLEKQVVKTVAAYDWIQRWIFVVTVMSVGIAYKQGTFVTHWGLTAAIGRI